MQKRFIAAVAGSAGSLHSIKQFFEHTASSHVSYLVVQHLPMDYKTQLKPILKKYSELVIHEAVSGERIEPNGVYVTPSDKYLTVTDDRIDLVPRSEMPNRSIDVLLKSLAGNSKERAIAVILSGTGSDGVDGIRAIKGTGGLILAQTPHSCIFPSMPINAIRSGCVDRVLSCKDMASAIHKYVHENR